MLNRVNIIWVSLLVDVLALVTLKLAMGRCKCDILTVWNWLPGVLHPWSDAEGPVAT